MVELIHIKNTPRYFVKNQWRTEFILYKVTIEGWNYYYHYLPDFFNINDNAVLNSLESIEKNYHSQEEFKHPSLNFFRDAIIANLTYLDTKSRDEDFRQFWPKTQALTGLKEFFLELNNEKPLRENSQYKLKCNLQDFLLWDKQLSSNSLLIEKLLKSRCQLIFDFNQQLTDTHSLKNVLKIGLESPWKNSLKYFEEPSTSAFYDSLSKEELSLIALDESLLDYNQLSNRLIEQSAYFVVKPSLLPKSVTKEILTINKPISLSSCYEHPSIKVGYIPFLKQNLHNSIHGLSTFELFV